MIWVRYLKDLMDLAHKVEEQNQILEKAQEHDFTKHSH